MPDVPEGADWSPADHPYAIALSEALWWRCAVQLSVGRLGDADDPRSAPVSSKQVDARNLVFALVQLLAVERLELTAQCALGADSDTREALSAARDRYLTALPDIQEMRNALTHFDDWAVGHGRGLRRQGSASGSEKRDVAAAYWGFGYYSSEQAVTLGPFDRQLLEDAPDTAHDADTGPGGHCGASQESSAVDSHPLIDTSDQPLPGPATTTLRPQPPTRKRALETTG